MSELLKINRQNPFYLITEIGRAAIEYGLHLPYHKLKKKDNVGDGHPVIIFPGLLATDRYTQALRKNLKDVGYPTYGWGEMRNLGKVEYLESIEERLLNIYDKHHEQISLIGWSLGGIYARQIAKTQPDKVRQVITLGTPFSGLEKKSYGLSLFKMITLGNGVKRICNDLRADFTIAPPVPTTAIYSKEDGIVSWESCMEPTENDQIQNIRIRGSHLGLSVNPIVLHILYDRLKQTKDNWSPFVPDDSFTARIFLPKE